MRNEFTALIEPDGEWFTAYCAAVTEANGQGRTREDAKKNLASSIALVLEDKRTDALAQPRKGSVREPVTVES